MLKNNNKNKGFTLVELIVSIALLSIILILFVNLFTFSVTLLSKSSKQKASSMNASSKIETDTAASANGNTVQTPGNFTITFGGTDVSAPGSFLSNNDSGSQVYYKSFIPDSIP